jgi:hypothetical protein
VLKFNRPNTLAVQEARDRPFRSEIDGETMRIKAEAPALETYASFRETFANKSNDQAHRPELRRALAALLERIVLAPHGKDGVCSFIVHLLVTPSKSSAKQNPKAGFIAFCDRRPKRT